MKNKIRIRNGIITERKKERKKEYKCRRQRITTKEEWKIR